MSSVESWRGIGPSVENQGQTCLLCDFGPKVFWSPCLWLKLPETLYEPPMVLLETSDVETLRGIGPSGENKGKTSLPCDKGLNVGSVWV